MENTRNLGGRYSYSVAQTHEVLDIDMHIVLKGTHEASGIETKILYDSTSLFRRVSRR